MDQIGTVVALGMGFDRAYSDIQQCWNILMCPLDLMHSRFLGCKRIVVCDEIFLAILDDDMIAIKESIPPSCTQNLIQLQRDHGLTHLQHLVERVLLFGKGRWKDMSFESSPLNLVRYLLLHHRQPFSSFTQFKTFDLLEQRPSP